MQHFWSLGVEEQFYLVWPMLIVMASIGLRKHGAQAQRRCIAVVLLAVTLASLAYSISQTASNPAAAFFVTPTRAWEFGAGGLLALLSGSATLKTSSLAARSTLSWVGIAAILLAAFTYSGSTPFPGWAAALPVLGAIWGVWARNSLIRALLGERRRARPMLAVPTSQSRCGMCAACALG